jgi:ribokinase
MKDFTICVVGSTNIDLTFRTARLPRSGETFAGKGFQLGFGGKGANQAVMAARLGARVRMVSRVGRDVFGEQAKQNFEQQGVDVTHVTRDDARPTGVAAILVDDAASNCIVVVAGANEAVSAADVRAAAAAIRDSSILLCQLETPLEASLEAFRIAKEAGVRTLFNPAPAAPLPDELLRLTDLLVPNEPEMEMLTGHKIKTMDDAKAAAAALRQRGPKTVVATLGVQGALIVSGNEVTHVPTTPVQAVDTTGAGDSFIGSLAVFLAEERPLAEAVRWANVVAAMSVTRPGTQTSFPRRAEVEGLR